MPPLRSFVKRLFPETEKKDEENQLTPPPPRPLTKEEEEIQARIASIPHWHHQIEVAPGIVTPGVSNTAQRLEWYEFPEDLSGKRVLDIGCYEGFFTFECERRGAEVVAIDVLPLGPQSGFSLAHKLLGSKATFYQTSIYDLTPERFGTFDLVLCFGVLYHLRHPLLGLERAHAVCRDRFILETQICDKYFINAEGIPVDLAAIAPALAQLPIAQFYPGNELNHDPSNWWSPNLPAVDGMLRSTGFIPDKVIHNGVRACIHCTRTETEIFYPGERPDVPV